MEQILNKIRFYDYHIYLFFHGAIHGRPWLNESYLFFAKYGIVLILLSSIYLILRGKIRAFFCIFVATFFAFVVDFLIAMFWKRPSPFIAHSDQILTPITQGLRVDSVSFPSAHTYIAFAIATSIFLYGHRKLGIVLFIIAALVAIGRMGAGFHYPSDIVGGALLGIASGIVAYLLIENNQKRWE